MSLTLVTGPKQGQNGSGEKPVQLELPSVKGAPKPKANPPTPLTGASILVTGATGFLGQYVVPALEAAGAKVVGIGKRHYDLSSEAQALSVMLAAHPHIVVHLAGVPETMKAAARIRESTLINLNMIHACAVARAKLVIVERPGTQVLTTAEICKAYADQHGLPSVILAPYEVYGPLDHFDRGRLVPDMVKLIAYAKANDVDTFPIEKAPWEERSLLFAGDAAEAVVAACTAAPTCTPLFLGGPESVRLERLFAAGCKVFSYRGRPSWDDTLEPGKRDFEGKLAREHLGWEPYTKIDDGLNEIFMWIQATTKKEEPDQAPPDQAEAHPEEVPRGS